jgi:hypothetical protein
MMNIVTRENDNGLPKPGIIMIAIPVPQRFHQISWCITEVQGNCQGGMLLRALGGQRVRLVGTCRLGCLGQVRDTMGEVYSEGKKTLSLYLSRASRERATNLHSGIPINWHACKVATA